jgi:hypothetical protein
MTMCDTEKVEKAIKAAKSLVSAMGELENENARLMCRDVRKMINWLTAELPRKGAFDRAVDELEDTINAK